MERLKQNSNTPQKETIDKFLSSLYNNISIYVGALIINIIVLLFSAYIFLVPNQSIDLFNGLVADYDISLFWLWVSITTYSLIMFYSTVISLYLKDLQELSDSRTKITIDWIKSQWSRFLRKKDKLPVIDRESLEIDFHDKIINFLPYLMGMSIYLIICWGFSRSSTIDNYLGWYYLISGIAVNILIWLTRKHVLVWIVKQIWGKNISVNLMISKKRKDWKDFSTLDKWIIRSLTIIIGLVLIGICTYSLQEIKPIYLPQYFTTSAILCIFLAGFVMLFSVIWGLLKFRINKLIFLAAIIIFGSMSNNNYQIRLTDQIHIEKPSVDQHFTQWLNERLDSTHNSDNPLPIFLIAAEGGGIRSMKWTALVLDQLYRSSTEFHEHVYALSGASGGSVGIVFQQASLIQGFQDQTKLENALNEDFLSPVTFGMLFTDITQSIAPSPVNQWDRSRWLEDAWQASFKKQYGSIIMDSSINDYWNSNRPLLSNIFLNSTVIETGQKAVISNLRLPKKYFQNTIDLDSKIGDDGGKGIPLKTAASLSARFPIVTSAGKITFGENEMQIVDGGYHDNTGLETLIQILNMVINTTDSSKLSKCKFSIILIKNNMSKKITQVESDNFLIDLTAAPRAIFNNWNDRTNSILKNTEIQLEVFRKLNINVEFHLFKLDREVFVKDNGEKATRVFDKTEGQKINLPLGWYMSESSNTEIARQAAALTMETLHPKDTIGLANQETFEKIVGQTSTNIK